jgi:UrcA family protein
MNAFRTSFVAIVAALAVVAFPLFSATTVLAADAGDVTSLTVAHVDLDIDSAQSVDELYVRLEAAARSACSKSVDGTNDIQRSNLQSCEQHAIKHAVTTLGLPLLTTIYERHFPGEPLPAASRISYAARDAVSGYMSARMPDGDAYSGEYLEPRQYERIDPSDPFWIQWCNDEGGAKNSDCGGTGGESFRPSRHEVLAGLKDVDGLTLRCRFALSQPSMGIAGGAQGQCLLPAGETVQMAIPRA